MLECEESRVPAKRLNIGLRENCIFCVSGVEGGELHNFTTLEADRNFRLMATELQDFQLLSRISGGDLIAIEAKYHFTCLTSIRNRYRSFSPVYRKSQIGENDDDERMSESRAFAELVDYVTKSVESGTQMFKLSELHNLFISRLADINKMRLKTSLLEQFSEAQEQHDGKKHFINLQGGYESLAKGRFKETRLFR